MAIYSWFTIKMVIFHSYASLPEGNMCIVYDTYNYSYWCL